MVDPAAMSPADSANPSSSWLSRDLSVDELSSAYAELAGQWLLVEVVAGELGRPDATYRLIAHDPDRERLHELVGERGEWNWERKCLLVLADPAKPCQWGVAP
jgi:hypothetical protein